jgi:hypothetical protein
VSFVQLCSAQYWALPKLSNSLDRLVAGLQVTCLMQCPSFCCCRCRCWLLRCSEPGCKFQGTRGQYEKHLGSKKANAPKNIYLKEEQINLQVPPLQKSGHWLDISG